VITIGVLALQGNFAKHMQMVERLSCRCKEVRTADELFACDALIIPGGESTVISRLILKNELKELLFLFGKSKPIFGTCAGLILLAKEGLLNLLDVEVKRNAYGRQVDSFLASCEVCLHGEKKSAEAFFIRAPKITRLLSKEVEVLSRFEGDPVFVKQGHIFAASFHPELTNDLTIHNFFVEEVLLCKRRKKVSHARQ